MQVITITGTQHPKSRYNVIIFLFPNKISLCYIMTQLGHFNPFSPRSAENWCSGTYPPCWDCLIMRTGCFRPRYISTVLRLSFCKVVTTKLWLSINKCINVFRNLLYSIWIPWAKTNIHRYNVNDDILD